MPGAVVPAALRRCVRAEAWLLLLLLGLGLLRHAAGCCCRPGQGVPSVTIEVMNDAVIGLEYAAAAQSAAEPLGVSLGGRPVSVGAP